MKNSSKDHMFHHSADTISTVKKRRGLSTIVSTAIIMSAIAIMGVMLVGWSNTNLFTQQATLENSFNNKMNKLNEDIVVENIWFGTGPSIVNVTLSNVGSVGLNVTKIQIQNTTGTIYFLISDGGMSPGDDYSMQETFNWNSGEVTNFSIFTERGNIFTDQEVT